MLQSLLCAAALFSITLPALAQRRDAKEKMVRRVEWISEDGAPHMPHTFQFIAAGAAELGKTVKNAPFSAEINTETTRLLADGTRIVNKSTSNMMRDQEGRTRREATISSIGPWTNGSQQPPRLVTITDPVAGEVLILNLNDKTARKSRMGAPAVFRTEKSADGRKEIFEERIHVEERIHAGVRAQTSDVIRLAPPGATGERAIVTHYDSRNTKTENLGRQVMEGVPVDGTRKTNTIPAGEIGNDRPIVSVTERWYSPDLQMVIFSKTTDPQFGETIYRVSSLSRAEPNPALFKAPAEFKVVELPRENNLRIMRGREEHHKQ
jgi:hypothetical protein